MRNFWVHGAGSVTIISAGGYSVDGSGTLHFWVLVLFRRRVILSVAAGRWEAVHADGAYDYDDHQKPTWLRHESIQTFLKGRSEP